jgi:DNA helicase II / ATP-dependent DNA helicase PcrA
VAKVGAVDVEGISHSADGQRLDILVPQRFYVHRQSGRNNPHLYDSRTRFVEDPLFPSFEQRTWPAYEQESSLAAGGRSEIQIDIGRQRARR